MLLRDQASGQPTGSALVWYTTRAAGERAILQFNMQQLAVEYPGERRPLVVRPADDWRLEELKRGARCWAWRGWWLGSGLASRARRPSLAGIVDALCMSRHLAPHTYCTCPSLADPFAGMADRQQQQQQQQDAAGMQQQQQQQEEGQVVDWQLESVLQEQREVGPRAWRQQSCASGAACA